MRRFTGSGCIIIVGLLLRIYALLQRAIRRIEICTGERAFRNRRILFRLCVLCISNGSDGLLRRTVHSLQVIVGIPFLRQTPQPACIVAKVLGIRLLRAVGFGVPICTLCTVFRVFLVCVVRSSCRSPLQIHAAGTVGIPCLEAVCIANKTACIGRIRRSCNRAGGICVRDCQCAGCLSDQTARGAVPACKIYVVSSLRIASI